MPGAKPARLDGSPEELLDRVLHDLRQPLNAIAGFAELLQDVPRADREECLREIRTNVARMERLLDELAKEGRSHRR